MKRIHAWLVGALIALISAVVIHVIVLRRISERRSQAALAHGQTLRLRRQVESTRTRLAKDRAPATQKATSANADQKPSQGPRKQTIGGLASPETKAIANDPQTRRWFMQAFIDREKLENDRLLTQFGATPQQREKFYQILAGSQEARWDLLAAAYSQGLDPNDASFNAQKAQARQTEMDQYQQLFGDRLEEWRQTALTLRSQTVVEQIMQENLQGDGAFNPAQAAQLTQILARNLGSYKATPDKTGYDWNAVMAQAAGILTPQQIEGFKLGAQLYRARTQMNALERSSP